MTMQSGKDLLLKIGDGAATESFTTVAGLRATSLAFDAKQIDATHAASSGMWRELLAETGIKSAALSGSGLFKDAASDALIRAAFFAQSLPDWQIVIPDFGIVSGPFKITALRYDGPFDGEVKISLTLASAGALSFTAI